jgi:hypothetical protein
VTLEWEGADVDRAAAIAAAEERARLVETRNGTRLLIDSPKSGQWIALDPLELEALTWQTVQTFSAMIGSPYAPMFPDPDPSSTRNDHGHGEG